VPGNASMGLLLALVQLGLSQWATLMVSLVVSK
jgi:hypothetical protein